MKNTLFLVQSDFLSTPIHFEQLHQVKSENDAIVLMGEAVLQHHHLKNDAHVYALESEKDLLAQQTTNIQWLSYTDFATLCLNYSRCISLK